MFIVGFPEQVSNNFGSETLPIVACKSNAIYLCTSSKLSSWLIRKAVKPRKIARAAHKN